MIDINLLRQEPELIRKTLVNRQKDVSLLDNALNIDKSRRELLIKVEELRSQQNAITRGIKGKPTEEQLKSASLIKEQLKDLEVNLKDL
jgi:seryl-tRNA synthetase